MTRGEFLSRWSRENHKVLLGDDHGGLKYPHGISKAEARRRDRRLSEQAANSAAASAAWQEALSRGLVREPSHDEKLEATASGHPDNPSVQAAQRVLEKRRQRMEAAGDSN